MIEDELVRIWQSSPNQERVKFEKSRLIIEVQSTLDQFHKGIKYRDLMEQIAAIVGMPVFAYYAYHFPYILTKIASVLIIFWGIFVIIRIRSAKKHKPVSFADSYLEYLYKSREYLKVQKELLDNILYWYILPAMTLMFMFILGPGVSGRIPKLMKTGAGIVAIGIVTYFLNKRAVKKQFIPRLEKIQKLITVMESSQ